MQVSFWVSKSGPSVEKISIKIKELVDVPSGFPPPPPLRQRINANTLIRFAFWVLETSLIGPLKGTV